MIGQRIKKIRENLGMLQRELASEVGKSATDICRIEQGQRRIKAEDLPTFAQALGVTVMDLLEEPTPKSA